MQSRVLDRGDLNAAWWDKQTGSLGSYAVTHAAEGMSANNRAIYQLFGAYINAAAYQTGKTSPAVLDVGCGIFSERSPAFTHLHPSCSYLGVDPLPENLDNRSYDFVCGRLEDVAALPEYANRFDVLVFGTSLDHLEDLDVAAAAVRELAAPGALLVAWNGLHDPDAVIADNAVAVFRRLLRYPTPIALLAYLGYGLMRLPRLLWRMRQRLRTLRVGGPLDHHSRWFTTRNHAHLLAAFGDVEDITNLPNTNSAFATVRIR